LLEGFIRKQHLLFPPSRSFLGFALSLFYEGVKVRWPAGFCTSGLRGHCRFPFLPLCGSPCRLDVLLFASVIKNSSAACRKIPDVPRNGNVPRFCGPRWTVFQVLRRRSTFAQRVALSAPVPSITKVKKFPPSPPVRSNCFPPPCRPTFSTRTRALILFSVVMFTKLKIRVPPSPQGCFLGRGPFLVFAESRFEPFLALGLGPAPEVNSNYSPFLLPDSARWNIPFFSPIFPLS